MNRKIRMWMLLLCPIFACGMAEAVAYWWMHPGLGRTQPLVLNLALPSVGEGWQNQPEIYSGVQHTLKCSAGTTGKLVLEEDKQVNIAFIEWNPDANGAPIEAFSHLPDQCMGSIGMKLEKIENRRYFRLADGNGIIFDSTIFRGGNQIDRVHVYKGIWVEGMQGADLRNGLFGSNHETLRTYRLKAALHRFAPRHSRVVMGVVNGAASSDEAWELFHHNILNRLSLQSAIP